MSNNYTLSFDQCKKFVEHTLRSKLVPCVESAPGMGKSSMAKQIAEQLDLYFIDIRLSTIDPMDLNGFAAVEEVLMDDGINTKRMASYLPMSIWPVEGTPLPINPATGQAYKGWLILFDELRSANPDIQAAAYRILLDHEVGPYKLHPRVLKMAATNGVDHGAVAYDAGTAIQSRLVWYYLRSDLEEFLAMAQQRGFDQRVMGYLMWKGVSALNNFNPDSDECNFACERTWENLSKQLKRITTPDISAEYIPMLAGTVGQSTAIEFQAYTQIYQNLYSYQDVLTQGKTLPIDTTRPDILYAMSARIQAEVNPQNAANDVPILMDYINRLPIEFQQLIMTRILSVAPMLQATCPQVTMWIQQKAAYLVSQRSQVGAVPVQQPAGAVTANSQTVPQP